MTSRARTGAKLAAIAALALVALLVSSSSGARTQAAVTCFGKTPTKTGTDRGDLLIGTPGPDVIVGGGGDDVISGLGGDDLICGGDGHDVLDGGEGNDKLQGGPGTDGLIGGPGNDLLVGGGGLGTEGIDAVDYGNASQAVRVDLATGSASGDGNDVLSGIEIVYGSKGDDVLLGSAGVDVLGGGPGNDVIDGRGGDDVAQFTTAGVTADLAAPPPSDQPAPCANAVTVPNAVQALATEIGGAVGEGVDCLRNLEGLIGSKARDVLTGDGRANYLAGNAGDDVVSGGGGDDRVYGDEGADVLNGGTGDDVVGGDAGNDTISGGGGLQDTVSYLAAPAGVNVNLAAGTASGDGTDTVSGFQNVSGSEFRDALVGDGAANSLAGNAGKDTISGGPGDDFLGGGAGANTLSDGPGTDYCLEGAGAARCEIKGVPGPLPGRAVRPPIRGARTALAIRRPARATVDRYPYAASGLLALGRSLGGLEGAAVRQLVRNLDDALTAFDRGAGASAKSYEYIGAPTCVVFRKPYRTSIAAPRRVEPVANDGEPEEAWWQATLYRLDERTRTWKPFLKTPWARAAIAGGVGIPGVPTWQDAKRSRFLTSFTRTVPPGQYVWRGEIYWRRNGTSIFRAIEPHIVFRPAVAHEKLCRFKG